MCETKLYHANRDGIQSALIRGMHSVRTSLQSCMPRIRLLAQSFNDNFSGCYSANYFGGLGFVYQSVTFSR